MKESQAEIRAIQAKLQALQMGHSSLRQSTPAIEPTTTLKTPTAVASTPSDHPENDRLQSDKIQNNKIQNSHVQGDRVQNSRVQNSRVQSDRPRGSQSFRRITSEKPPSEKLMLGRMTDLDVIPAVLPRQPLDLPEPPISPLSETLQRLEAQAERVNQLSTAQEAALLELKAIAEQVERDRKTLAQSDFEGDDDLEGFDEDIPTWECLETIVPLVERDQTGTFVVTTRSIDLFRAEREALLTAQTLRYRLTEPASQSHTPQQPTRHSVAKRNSDFSLKEELIDWGQPLLRKISALIRGRRHRRTTLRRHQSAPTLTVQDAAIWIIGAIVARKGLDLLLAAVPGLWLPVVGLIGVAAAIAIYRTTFTPEFGFTWGYRLFLVMLGLLVGGRL
jgi:hypothetical protein